MLALPGYQVVEKVGVGRRCAVYRAYGKHERHWVIVKVLRAEAPTLDDIALLKQEYAILEGVEHDGILRPYGLLPHHTGHALILEDCGGRSLKELLAAQHLPVEECLRIGIALAGVLDAIHRVPILHKRVEPSNVLIVPETGLVKLTNFGHASRLSVEHPADIGIARDTGGIARAAGALAYLAPEQAGRLGRPIDHRSDLYALGVTLYEMLTRRLPFATHDPVDLARVGAPVPPHQIDPEIPEPVSDIVMKLLAKAAEDRYQSASGLQADLEECLARLQAHGDIGELVPGRHDRAGALLIPRRRYGRDAELNALMAAFERSSGGSIELMLISGGPGVGKTFLANELLELVVGRRGYFVAGSFEQRRRNAPYQGLVQAFRALLRQVWAEGPHRLGVVRAKILEAVAPNGRVLADLMPEVASLLGPLPPVPALPATESQHRLRRVLQQLTRVFARAEHPLVMVIDDLQWADAASLKLIESLVTDPEPMHLLIIGAYRDDEVDAIHPLAMAISDLREAAVDLHRIVTPPLSSKQVTRLVLETVAGPRAMPSPALRERVQDLAELLYLQTGGNPRYLIQVLSSLHSEGLLTAGSDAEAWAWDPAAIEAAGISERSLVELVGADVHLLPETTRHVLQLAACLGESFELDILATLYEQTAATTATHLWDALQAGLVLPLSTSYKMPVLFGPDEVEVGRPGELAVAYRFVHDRAREAAYATIPEPERKRMHIEIGRTLLERIPLDARADIILLIADQLDLGRELLDEGMERDELAGLNLLAAREARAAGASEAALRYVAVGMELLGPDCWSSRYETSMAFSLEALATEHASGNFERVDRLADVALRHARSAMEQAAIHSYQIESLVARRKMQPALDCALHALQVLGISLYMEPPEELSFDHIDDTPGAVDTSKYIAHRILAAAARGLYMLGPDIVGPVSSTRLHLCQNAATPRIAADAAMDHAIWLCSTPEGIERGHRFGRMALEMLERFAIDDRKGPIQQKFHTHIAHWAAPIKESLAPLRSAIQLGLDHGAPLCAGEAAIGYCTHLFFLGENLEFVDGQCARYSELMGRLGLTYHASAFDIIRQMLWSLLGRSREHVRLVGDLFDESVGLPLLEQSGAVPLLFAVYFEKLLLAYLFGDCMQAVDSGRMAARYAAGVTGMLFVAEHNLFYSLALLAACRKVDAAQRDELLRQVEANQEQMQHWVTQAPFNFAHEHELVEAEKARVLGQHREALELFDRAIEGAKAQGGIHIQALACELAADLYAALGDERGAREYLTDAYLQYERWGAWAKLKDLEARHSLDWLRAAAPKMRSAEAAREATPGPGRERGPRPAPLDLGSVMAAAQSIASAIDLDAVLERGLQIIAEHAGAERGALALMHEDELYIDAIYGDAIHGPAGDAIQTLDVARPLVVDGMVPAFSPEIIQHVARTREPLALDDVRRDSRFDDTVYVQERTPRSILCVPLLDHDELLGVVYLENNAQTVAFPPHRVDIVQLLGAQAAVAITNARTVTERMEQTRLRLLQSKNADLEREAWELARLNVDKDKFFSIISHDLRNPFNMMLNLVEIAVDEVDVATPEEMKDMLLKLQQAAESCYTLLENLLTWSRLQSGRMAYKPVAADLHGMAEGTVILLQRVAEEKGITLRNAVERDMRIHADRFMIDMVIRNLISNALKFTPRGGEVVVSARMYGAEVLEEEVLDVEEVAAEEAAEVFEELAPEVDDGAAPEMVEVAVRDTGIGIRQEDIDKLFRSDVHHTTKGTANEQGTGLGLAMCVEMVKQNGGEIRVESEVGVGTTFLFTVPVFTESSEGDAGR